MFGYNSLHKLEHWNGNYKVFLKPHQLSNMNRPKYGEVFYFSTQIYTSAGNETIVHYDTGSAQFSYHTL